MKGTYLFDKVKKRKKVVAKGFNLRFLSWLLTGSVSTHVTRSLLQTTQLPGDPAFNANPLINMETDLLPIISNISPFQTGGWVQNCSKNTLSQFVSPSSSSQDGKHTNISMGGWLTELISISLLFCSLGRWKVRVNRPCKHCNPRINFLIINSCPNAPSLIHPLFHSPNSGNIIHSPTKTPQIEEELLRQNWIWEEVDIEIKLLFVAAAEGKKDDEGGRWRQF